MKWLCQPEDLPPLPSAGITRDTHQRRSFIAHLFNQEQLPEEECQVTHATNWYGLVKFLLIPDSLDRVDDRTFISKRFPFIQWLLGWENLETIPEAEADTRKPGLFTLLITREMLGEDIETDRPMDL